MKSYSEFLAAGVPLQLQIGGKVLYVQRSEAGQVLKVEFLNGVASQSVDNVGKGFKAAPVGGFGSIKITATESGTVDFVVTDGDIDVKFDDAATVIGNDDSQAVPVRLPAGQRMLVDVAGGNVQLTATNVGINNSNDLAIPVQMQALGTIINGMKAINAGAAQQVSADAALKRLRFRNASADKSICLGGANVTFANAAIVLAPGDMWIEDDAAGATWFAAADAAGADLRIMGVKA